jgi:hypothetical protein
MRIVIAQPGQGLGCTVLEAMSGKVFNELAARQSKRIQLDPWFRRLK